MTQSQRQYLRHLDEFGVTILARRTNRHLVIKCQSRTGQIFTIPVPSSPSDCRTELNFRARLRRYSRPS